MDDLSVMDLQSRKPVRVSSPVEPVHISHDSSFITQCRFPIHSLTASRGMVGSSGFSLIHSFSTFTARADYTHKHQDKSHYYQSITRRLIYIYMLFILFTHSFRHRNKLHFLKYIKSTNQLFSIVIIFCNISFYCIFDQTNVDSWA